MQGILGSDFTVLTGEAPSDYEVFVGGRPGEELMKSPSLRTLIIPFAGVPDPTLALLKGNPHVSGHNLHHNAADTAEMAVALLFAAAKLVVPMDQRFRRNDWGTENEDARALSLEGKTALVLGYGEIGRRIARTLVACGLNVIALRRSSAGKEDGVEVRSIDDLHSLLPRANVLMVALPLTAKTTGLIGAKELAALPKNAVVVNIARGAIIDEEALYNALKEGKLHSAGLDVWYQYPKQPEPGQPDPASNTPPSKFPFGELENVVMSPHRGGTSMDTEPRRARDIAAIISATARGEEPPNRIDLDAGY